MPTEPLFFPFPENPPLSSTPAQSPGLPSISPRYRRTPSNPRDSIRTLSPTSKALPVRLMLLGNASDWRLGGRTDVGVLARSGGFGWLLVEDEEATEDGLP